MLHMHCRLTLSSAISSSILKIIYGIDVVEKDDPHISEVDAALEGLSLGLVPGKYWVEFLPFLRHVPAWVPGAGFQKQFSAWRASALAMKNDTFAYVKPSLVSIGPSHASFLRIIMD